MKYYCKIEDNGEVKEEWEDMWEQENVEGVNPLRRRKIGTKEEEAEAGQGMIW